MRPSNRLIRLAVVGLFGTAAIVPPAHAQELAPPAVPDGGTVVSDGPSPPARVGRLADLAGSVSFHGPGAEQWSAATPNFPVTDGDAVWTEPGGRAAIEVSGDRVALAGGTELDVDTLDDRNLNLSVPQGEAYVRLRALIPGEVVTVRTPRGAVAISAAGRYDIVAGDTTAPTVVTVLDGAAQVNGDSFGIVVRPGQSATLAGGPSSGAAPTGQDEVTATIGPAQRTAFLNAELSPPPAPPPPPAAAPPPVVEAMSGAEDLSAYGTWQPTPQYGTVWYPQVAPGWVPYRDGHWAYVAPWGWTWIDNEPWGFAPFHYGRWVEVGGRWGWAPVYAAPGYEVPPLAVAPPVYAPALVAFVGVGIGVGLAIGAALAPGADCGWVPLGWNEPYRPWYRHRPEYVGAINRTYVSNVTNINNITNVNNVTVNNYANRRAATIVPAAAVVNSRPIAPVARPVPQAQFAALRAAPVPPVRPTAGTLGVTPAVARQLNLPPAPPGAPVRQAAPGPRFTEHAARAAAPPQGSLRAAPLPNAVGSPLHAAPAPIQVHPPAAAVPAHPLPTTGNALPTLRPPGAPRADLAHPHAEPPQVVHPNAQALPAAPQPYRTPQAQPLPPQVVHPQVAHPEVAHPNVPGAPTAPQAYRPVQPQPVRPAPVPQPQVYHPPVAQPQGYHPPAPPPYQQRQAYQPPAPVPQQPRPVPVQPQAYRPPPPAPQAYRPPPPAPQAYRAPAPAPQVYRPPPPPPAPRPAPAPARPACQPGKPC